jgi:phosphoribosylanthranilate isomerase
MEIKICGITNLYDAIVACISGADAIGFIFYRKSPRYVTAETVRDINKKIPQDISTVGVFVNHDPREVKEIFTFCGLSFIQLHGDESAEYCRQFPASILIKSIYPRSERELSVLQNFPAKTILVDSRDKGLYGGTGKISNWQLAAKVKKMHPLILSGGLNADNILEAIETVSPHAVDVNSGVEQVAGKKDPEKVKNIIKMVHQVGRKGSTSIFKGHDDYRLKLEP